MREGPGCLETRAFRVLGAKGVVVIPKQDAPGQSRSRKVVPATPAMSRPDSRKPAGESIQHGLDGHGHSMLVRKDPGDGTDLPPNVGMRCCGLPASSRQCGRCLGWSSTYAEAADTSEPPNASPIPHHRSGFDRRAAYEFPCFVPALANANNQAWTTSQRRG